MDLKPYDSMEYIEFYTETVAISNQIDSTIKHIGVLKEKNYRLYGEANVFKALIAAVAKAVKFVGQLFKKLISKISGGKLFGGTNSSASSVAINSMDVVKGIYKTVSNTSSSEIESTKTDIRNEIQRTLKNKAEKEKLNSLVGSLSDTSDDDLEKSIVNISKKLNDRKISKANESINYIEKENFGAENNVLKSEFKGYFPKAIKDNLDDSIIDALNMVYKNNRNKFLKIVDKGTEVIFKNGNISDPKFKDYYNQSNALQFLYVDKLEMDKQVSFANHMNKVITKVIGGMKKVESAIEEGGESLENSLKSTSNNKTNIMMGVADKFPKYAGSKIERRRNMLKQKKNVEPLPQPKPADPTSYAGYIKGARIENPQSIFNKGDNFKNFLKFHNIFRVNKEMYNLLQYVYGSFNNEKPEAKKLVESSNKVVDASDKLSELLTSVDSENVTDNMLADLKDIISSYRVLGEYVIAMDMVAKNQLVNAANLKDIFVQIRYQFMLLVMLDSIRKYNEK